MTTAQRQSDDDVDMGIRGAHHASRGPDDRFWGKQGAGILLIARDTGRVLLVLRSPEVNEPNTWGVPGGAIDGREKPRSAARREAHEEVGYTGSLELHAAYVFSSKTFKYHNFLGVVDAEFDPNLDWENSDSGWFDLEELPSPLHFGVTALLANSRKQIQDIIRSTREEISEGRLRNFVRAVLIIPRYRREHR